MKYWTKEDDPKIPQMRRRLDHFYANTTQYNAFQSISNQAECWKWVAQEVRARLANSTDTIKIRVLEFGAGRTGFARYLNAELRHRVHFSVQDITPQNKEFLREEADEVFIGDVDRVDGEFDILFSTFVWEHISNPAATLEQLLKLTNSKGKIFLFSPRYDLPLYCPPALRHLSKTRQYTASVKLYLGRLGNRLAGRPGFWVTPDPAVLNTPNWFRDSDAVHLVSLYDLKSALRGRARVRTLYHGINWRRRQSQLRVCIGVC